ncbi:Antidote-toxin recognition MazE, bacterial antitoxin [uncultured archaeon]|nr:Antidote-toxin recognition MazE, bacterial antitoxin [uncultured archaeon]
MAKKEKNISMDNLGCCKVESVVSVDERGQMVLPKELREKANIKAGDKLALINWENDGESICICMIKIEKLAGLLKNILGPVMKELGNGGNNNAKSKH